MMRLRTVVAIAVATCSLTACMGSQTGKGLNAFDSKYKDSMWYTDDSGPLHSNSFWYSGYSDDDIEKAGGGGGGPWSLGPSDAASGHSGDSGAGHTDSGSSQ